MQERRVLFVNRARLIERCQRFSFRFPEATQNEHLSQNKFLFSFFIFPLRFPRKK